MSHGKTLRKKVRSDKTHKKQISAFSPIPDAKSTMEIPLDDILEHMSYENSYHIDIVCPGMDDKRIHLTREEIVIGRGENCSMKLPISNISRLHARIFSENEEFIIEDLNSTNGTFVNNVRISRCILRNNDQIKVGAARILFVHEKKAQ